MLETDKAYIAGLFDGEGSVGYYRKRNGYHTMQVSLTNCDLKVLNWLKESVGFGSIASNTRSGQYVGWAWICNGTKQVTNFLMAIRPYLRIKADQVDLLLSLKDAEQEIRGEFKLSPEVLLLRDTMVEQLKLLKTTRFTSIQ